MGQGDIEMATPVGEVGRKCDFAAFDGKRIAVVLSVGGRPRVCRGTAAYKTHPTLGPVLGVRVEGEADFGVPELLLSETRWRGEISPDTRHGCDYCFVPSNPAT